MTPPKPLTAEETAAVEVAIAAGRLQRIPLGVYAEDTITPVPLAEQIRRSANAGKSRVAAHNRRIAQEAAARREKAARLSAKGLTRSEIAERLGVTRSVVSQYLGAVPA
ncbi:hypothetical protein CNY89_02685 [Amaricoccus sp. HAR-UPW-R2A-40]|nr:hypothetical protein CNY89_02685 [Amaricoccus sp. HAR-UPW-R2A-40]